MINLTVLQVHPSSVTITQGLLPSFASSPSTAKAMRQMCAGLKYISGRIVLPGQIFFIRSCIPLNLW